MDLENKTLAELTALMAIVEATDLERSVDSKILSGESQTVNEAVCTAIRNKNLIILEYEAKLLKEKPFVAIEKYLNYFLGWVGGYQTNKEIEEMLSNEETKEWCIDHLKGDHKQKWLALEAKLATWKEDQKAIKFEKLKDTKFENISLTESEKTWIYSLQKHWLMF